MIAEIGLGSVDPDPDFPDEPDEWGLHVPDIWDVYRLMGEHYELSLPRRQVRGDSFRADWRITDPIRHAAACGVPDPGVVCSDDGPEFIAFEEQVRAALEEEPRKEPDLARRTRRSPCDAVPLRSEDCPHVSESFLKGILPLMTTTQRLLDLASAAPATRDEDLVLLLREASELYQQGFADLRDTVAARFAGLSGVDLVAAATAAGLPCDASQDRDELVLLLALTEWEMTPAALAYSEMAQDAARRGVCLIPEE
ncbi:hypothetical protein OG805_33865 [Streptomyces cellulosae]|nr:hypothetical protein OG805_00055 [Streptomyces cellulosae]WSB95240.1 hypothetical protein OG805_33865 [Streptomyces cellulosae]